MKESRNEQMNRTAENKTKQYKAKATKQYKAKHKKTNA